MVVILLLWIIFTHFSCFSLQPPLEASQVPPALRMLISCPDSFIMPGICALLIESYFRIEWAWDCSFSASWVVSWRWGLVALLGLASSHLLSTAPSLDQSSPCLPICVGFGLSHSLSLVNLTVAVRGPNWGRQEEMKREADCQPHLRWLWKVTGKVRLELPVWVTWWEKRILPR